MNYSIYVESTPNPEVMKFVSNRMIADKSMEIKSLDEAQGISIAEELLRFPFVKSIYLSSNFINFKNWNNRMGRYCNAIKSIYCRTFKQQSNKKLY